MPEPKHTPLPWVMHWQYDHTGYPSYYINGLAGPQKRDDYLHKANLTFVVRACNSHYKLLAAAKVALLKMEGENIMGGCAACGSEIKKHHRGCIVVQLRAAIAKATNGKEADV